MYSHGVMVLISVALLVGVTAGFGINALAGRSSTEAFATLRTTLRTPTKDVWILAIGVVGTTLIGLNIGANLAQYVLATSLICIAYGAIINRHFAGMSVIALGAALNLIPLLLNGYLPVDPHALVAAGIVESDSLYRVMLGAGRQLQSVGDLATGLGPIIGVSWLGEVISFGDLIIAVGLCNVCYRLLWPTDPALRPRPEVAENHVAERGQAEAMLVDHGHREVVLPPNRAHL